MNRYRAIKNFCMLTTNCTAKINTNSRDYLRADKMASFGDPLFDKIDKKLLCRRTLGVEESNDPQSVVAELYKHFGSVIFRKCKIHHVMARCASKFFSIKITDYISNHLTDKLNIVVRIEYGHDERTVHDKILKFSFTTDTISKTIPSIKYNYADIPKKYWNIIDEYNYPCQEYHDTKVVSYVQLITYELSRINDRVNVDHWITTKRFF